jgi:transposase-like protein
MTLALVGNTLLRTAITRNLVTFPAQIQPFMKRTNGDLQERIVQLYFVRGWTVRSICERYAMSKAMIHKLLAEWRVRAVESGYIQEIEPGCLAALQPEMNGASRENRAPRLAPAPLVAERISARQPAYSSPLPVSMPVANQTAAMFVARSS